MTGLHLTGCETADIAEAHAHLVVVKAGLVLALRGLHREVAYLLARESIEVDDARHARRLEDAVDAAVAALAKAEEGAP